MLQPQQGVLHPQCEFLALMALSFTNAPKFERNALNRAGKLIQFLPQICDGLLILPGVSRCVEKVEDVLSELLQYSGGSAVRSGLTNYCLCPRRAGW